MTGYERGVLVRWPRGDNQIGVVVEVMRGGKQVRARFDDGSEQIFVSGSSALKRFFFQPGDPVRVQSQGSTGVVTGGKLHEEKIFYTVALPGNVVKAFAEAGLRPAPLTDPVACLRRGKVTNPRKFALRSVAARYAFANRYGEFASLENSRIEAKPHQVSVAHRIINNYPHRFLLCDEVGLGKTIEAGMVLKELRARGVVKRVLILVPANLLLQWQFELKTKFNETFPIYNGLTVKALQQGSEENVWTINDSILTSHSFAAHTDERIEEIASVDWDVVIIDEAHHARETYSSGSSTRKTRLYRLAERLSDVEEGGRRSLLLLTATPMQLDPRELYSLVDLLDPALFPSVEAFQEQRVLLPELNRLARAVEKYGDAEAVSRVLRADGGSPGVGNGAVYGELERRIRAVLGNGSFAEQGETAHANGGLASAEGRERIEEALRRRHRLSEVLIRNRKSKVGEFQRRQAFNWPVQHTEAESEAYAEVERYVREGYQRALATQNNALGFVMVIFQKLMASSGRALRTSLRKRRERLAAKVAAYEAVTTLEEADATDEEAAAPFVERVSAEEAEVISPEELMEELLHLDELIFRLERIRVDSKAKALLGGIEGILEKDPQAKVIIFTQFRETQEMLADFIGERWPVYVFHGGFGTLEKDKSIAGFREAPGPCFLISTEAGGEGRNLQFCHLLVNYDLPWNPMRVEQRIGRVDRIGQENTVTVFNFAVEGTIEERVLDVLERRIGLFEQTVGGLDPILGNVEMDLRRIFQLAEKEANRAYEEQARTLEHRVAAARRAEEQLADFIMDARSFQPEVARRIMGREEGIGRDAMAAFTKALLKDRRTIVEPQGEGVYELIFREPFLSDFPKLLQDGGQRMLACFEPGVARDEETVQFLTFGHPIVDALVEEALDAEYEGMAAVRHVRHSGLSPTEGYQFNYVLEVGGTSPRKEVFSVFVGDDGRADPELGQRLLELEAAFDDERGEDGAVLQNLEALDGASEVAEYAAAAALDDLYTGLIERNRENLGREREKLERYFDYRAVVAEDKINHARKIVRQLEASEDPSVQKILPLWRANLDRAVAVQEGLAADREKRLLDLDNLSMPEAGYSLLGSARVVVYPSGEGEDA